jgi:hypothetical protein
MRNTFSTGFLVGTITATLWVGCDGSTHSLGGVPKDAGGGQPGLDANPGGGAAGSVATGGLLGAGGASSAGGVIGTGGRVGTGGASSAVGGAMGTGGRVGNGGASGTGGGSGVGGGSGRGGAIATGGSGGGGSTGSSGTGGRGGTGGSSSTGGSSGTGGSGTGGSGTGGSGTGDAGGGDAGQASTYSGCRYIGGIDRAVVAKLDAQAGVCVALALAAPNGAPDAGFGMTITPTWGVESTSLWPSTTGPCSLRGGPAGSAHATSASGSVIVNSSPPTIDIDAVLYFPATDGGAAQAIELQAQGVDINRGC